MATRSTFRLLFLINKSKIDQFGQCPILLRITSCGETATFSAKRKIHVDQWNQKAGAAIGNSQETDELNLYLETLRNKAFNKYRELLLEHDDVTASLVRDAMLGAHGSTSRKILEIWEEHNMELKALIGKTVAHATFQKHQTCLKHFREFLNTKLRSQDVPVKLITRSTILKFELFLIDEKGLGKNSAIKTLSFLKKIILLALKNGWMVKNPFSEIRLTLEEVDRGYLTDVELANIHTKAISNKRLSVVRDLFVFACYTGLSYSDVRKLKRSEIEQTPDGMWWIRTRRQKTKTRSQIPLLAVPKSILDKYADISWLNADDRVLPVLSNQKLNAYLKEIADICKIDKNITFHLARHTFATTVTLMNGVPIESVSRMLGHKSLRTTQHYARIVDKKVAEDMVNLSKRINMGMAV